MRLPSLAGLLAAAALAAACGAVTEPMPVFEPAARGPSADEVFVMRSYLTYGRQPSFDERRRFEDHLEDRVGQYLRAHPELEQSPRYSEVRFWRQVGEGTPREEVLVLLQEPDERTREAARLRQLGDRFWPALSDKQAVEAWRYPGWVLFFDEQALVGFIKVLNPPPSASMPGRQ
jgi:hypothetical protein